MKITIHCSRAGHHKVRRNFYEKFRNFGLGSEFRLLNSVLFVHTFIIGDNIRSNNNPLMIITLFLLFPILVLSNPCQDSTYISLKAIEKEKLSQSEFKELFILEKVCITSKDSVVNDHQPQYSHADGPCNDSLLVALKSKNLDALSDREYTYLQNQQQSCNTYKHGKQRLEKMRPPPLLKAYHIISIVGSVVFIIWAVATFI